MLTKPTSERNKMHINNTLNVDLNTYGFPQGYFVIKNVATNRLLDVEAGKVEDGTNIILWTENDSSLVEGEGLDITILIIILD